MAVTALLPLSRLRLRTPPDVFAVRQAGREVAAATGLGHEDQVGLAIALSEAGRVLLAAGVDVEVAFSICPGRTPTLWVEMTGGVRDDGGIAAQLAVVARLMDTMEVRDAEPGTVVRISRRLPPSAPPLTPARMDELRARIDALLAGSPLDEIAVQNGNLIDALEQVQAQRDELARLNAELQETNRGVMALYNQLSAELEETNRGVVALYAELDEKSAQLRAASEAKTRFLANVSHELRAPVTAIIGLGRLLADSASDPLTADQARQVELIRDSASDLLALVNNLLDLAKVEAGRIEPNWSEVDLRVVFAQLRGTLRVLANRPEVTFVVGDPDPGGRLRSDDVLLAQVLRNLLTNALKFTDAGEVRLTAQWLDGGRRVELAVADTGIGIAPELHERIFEEFYQVPGAASRAAGTGLGLPYARRLVGILGGALTVASRPGEGSVFTVHLPADGGG